MADNTDNSTESLKTESTVPTPTKAGNEIAQGLTRQDDGILVSAGHTANLEMWEETEEGQRFIENSKKNEGGEASPEQLSPLQRKERGLDVTDEELERDPAFRAEQKRQSAGQAVPSDHSAADAARKAAEESEKREADENAKRKASDPRVADKPVRR